MITATAAHGPGVGVEARPATARVPVTAARTTQGSVPLGGYQSKTPRLQNGRVIGSGSVYLSLHGVVGQQLARRRHIQLQYPVRGTLPVALGQRPH